MIITTKGSLSNIKFESQKEAQLVYKVTSWVDKDGNLDSIITRNKDGTAWSFRGISNYLNNFHGNKFKITEHNEVLPMLMPSINSNILEGITLKDFQVEAANAAIRGRFGIIACPTSSGKSEIMLAVYKWLMDNNIIESAMVIVPSVQLLGNISDRAQERGIPKSDIGLIYGKKKELSEKKFYIAVVNSLYSLLNKKDDNTLELIKSVKCVFWDEGHHIKNMMSCGTFARMSGAEFNLCITGSPFGTDEITKSYPDSMVYCVTGGLLYTIGYDTVYESGLTSKPYCSFINISGKMSKTKAPYLNVYNKYIMNNQERNATAVNVCNWLVDNGVSVLILVQRIDHASKIMTMLNSNKVISVFGGNVSVTYNNGVLNKEPVNYSEFKDSFSSGKYNVVIGSQVLDEGFDLPTIGAVIMLGGGKSKTQYIQRVGRGLRKKKSGKNVVYIFDFADHGHVFLLSQSKKRLKLYSDIGVEILGIKDMKDMVERDCSIDIEEDEESFNLVKELNFKLASLKQVFIGGKINNKKYNENIDLILDAKNSCSEVLTDILNKYKNRG